MNVPNPTPISVHHHMAVNMDTDGEGTLISYEASEGDVIHFRNMTRSVWNYGR